MGAQTDNKIYAYLADLIEGSGAKDIDKIKMGILARKFYDDMKESFDAAKVPFLPRKVMMGKFMVFMVQFETIVIKAHRPITGSGSSGEEIVRLYQDMNREKLLNGLPGIKTKLLN